MEKQDLSIIDVGGEGERIVYSNPVNLEPTYAGRLGEEYRISLNLTERQTTILNRMWYPDNNFSSIPFCRAEIVKLFVLILDDLAYKYAKERTVLEVQFNTLADMITRKHLANGMNDYNYKYTLLSTLDQIYFNLFKHAENALRAHYGHTRKINTDVDYGDEEINNAYHARLTSKVLQMLPIWVPRVDMPDEATNIALYTQNANRWKLRFEEICSEFKHEPKKYLAGILKLAKLNASNPAIEMIYFEASKFIAAHDPQIALILYIYYIHSDLQSIAFDNRQLTKTAQKNIFKTKEQVEAFQTIVRDLISNQDLNSALLAVPSVFSRKRKTIQLDPNAIAAINERHSGTVELLNKYLQEDTEDDTKVVIPDLIVIEAPIQHCVFIETLPLTAIQVEIILHFAKNNFVVPQQEIERIAKEKGLFKNQLVEGINETCYETIDDVLIEEEEDNYIIYETYYKSILAS
ncbi:hypothetical protein DBR43_00755 [Pedobacter sp. KBW06]|uniref:tellurite resistance TerB C-terminal domain-containing protein n=1 Tax=Pedobacter sp. KBW06 TaxID=2153359 RepID=UPI000F5AABF6|nr:tellurite resistance TerB C-terminal domain-containing protein [Pedobacter sp. KBW06]RQO73970.1 hypothetical protein DBR43_00755 [Pedobacter sp. KBW06]